MPLLLSTDQSVLALTTSDEVLSAVRQQIEGMRAADYERSETLESDTVALNATSSLHGDVLTTAQGASEIGRLRATYLTTMARAVAGSPPSSCTPTDARAPAPQHGSGTDFTTVTDADLDAVADELNDRPRKRFAFATPTEQIAELLLQ